MSKITEVEFDFLGCFWSTTVVVEGDDAVTPGSQVVEEIHGYVKGAELPAELIGHMWDDVAKKALEASRG